MLRCSLATSSGLGGAIEVSLAPGSELISAGCCGKLFVVFRGGPRVDRERKRQGETELDGWWLKVRGER